ncbi:MAG: biotin/lipoyl-binding protein, partial [Tissierellia bacterium]|nr:biotin/lipoyl-binding protein [Tissierellia bacterium]
MKKKKIIIGGIFFLALVAAIYLMVRGSNKGIEVSLIDVEQSNIVKTIEMSGSIYANDSQELEIPKGVKVKEVYFKENDLVKKGDVLAVLDSIDLNLRLEKAQITLAQIDADIKNPESKVGVTDSGVLSNNID